MTDERERLEKIVRCRRPGCHAQLGAVVRRNGVRRFMLYVRVVVNDDPQERPQAILDNAVAPRTLIAEITGAAKIYCWRCGEPRSWFPDLGRGATPPPGGNSANRRGDFLLPV